MHPADYHDGAPSDCFLSGHLYEKRASFIANSPAGILSDIRRIFQEISKKPFAAGYDEWITWLEWITEHKGE
jgi:hypothetical protein